MRCPGQRLRHLPRCRLRQRLQSLSNQQQAWLKSTLTYEDDTVGALLSGELIRVREKQQLSQVLQQEQPVRAVFSVRPLSHTTPAAALA